MKKIIAIVFAGAAITTAALAFAGKQSAAADGQGCGSCCTVSCPMQDT
jgi:hypothetical protein